MTARVIPVSRGREAHDALERVVAAVKRDDPMTMVTVLVPSDIAGIAVRRRFARGVGGRPGVAGIHISTLPRLAGELSVGRLGGRRPATTPLLAAAWRAELQADPGRFEGVAEHAATVRALVRAHRDLRDLNEAGLDAIEASGTLAADAVRLHRRVLARLSGRYDDSDVLAVATELVAAGDTSTPPLVLFLPEVPTQRETAFLSALAARVDFDVIVESSGSARGDAAVAAGLSAAGILVNDLSGAAPLAGTVFTASDSDDEVRWVVRRVMRELDRRNADRIAVLYAAEAPYARLLHEHLAAADIAVNGPGVVAVRDRAVSRGFLALLELPASQFGRMEVFSALGQTPIRFDGMPVPTSRWESISREAGVVRGDDWATRLEAHAAQLQVRHDRAVADERDGEGILRAIQRTRELQGFVAGLRSSLGDAPSLGTWAELSAWALALLREYLGAPEQLVGRLPRAELSALAALESILAALGELDEVDARADLGTLVAVLDAELDTARPRVGRFGEGVFVGPISAAAGLDIDVAYLVGLSEDAYPGRTAPDALLPDAIRTLPEVRLIETRDRITRKAREMSLALATADEVVATFARGDLRRSTDRLPSRWLLPSIRALAGNDAIVATEWDRATGLASASSHWNELRRTEDAASDLEWRLRAAAAGTPLDDPRVSASIELIHARESDAFTRFDGNLDGVGGLPDFATNGEVVAPTTLERYAVCPHAYLVQHLLRVTPLELPEDIVMISPLNSGNLIHEAFDTFFRRLERPPGFGEPWTDDHKSALRAVAREIGARFVTAGLTGHPRMWSRDLAAVLTDLDGMLDDDSQFRADRGARVTSTELSFGRDGVDPVRVAVPRGTVNMSGSVDKIDEQEDGRVIVQDIKSGKAESFKPIASGDVVVGGTKLQLPAYALAARQQLGAATAEAQYWFVRRDAGTRVPVVLDGATEATYSSAVATLTDSIAAGLFPAKAPEKEDYSFVTCYYCNPDGIGHSGARAAWERKRTDPALADLVGLIEPGVQA